MESSKREVLSIKGILNRKETQHPPDTYYLRNKDQDILRAHIQDPQKVQQHATRATPNQRMRYRLFSLQQKDLDHLEALNNNRPQISRKDQWHDGSERRSDYQLMYKGIRHTEDILYRFQNNETRVADKSRRDQISETYKTIDDRFYNPKISTSTKMGQSLKAKIMDLANTKKHDRVRRNKVEKAKLDALEKELQGSPRLREVETEQAAFERQTSQEFTSQIIHEFKTLRVEEMLRASLGPKRFVREKAEQPLTKQQKEIQSMFEKKMLESYSNFEIQPSVTAPDEEKSAFTNSDRRLFVLSPKSMGLGSVKRSSQASKVASLRDSKETFSLPPLNENSVCLTSRSGINAEL